MNTIIKVESIKKGFGKHLVLDSIDLEINKGDIFGIIGLSGSGKTTLLKTIVGFLEPEYGRIYFYNFNREKLVELKENISYVKNIVGFSTQEPSFYSRLTVIENLDYFGSLYGVPKEIRYKNIIKLLQLTGLYNVKDVIAEELSVGMQKRLSIACALIHNPKIVILDEPTADLDPINRRHVFEIIKNINKLGTTVIIASHLLRELETICNKIAILHNKRIVEVGTPSELKRKYLKNDEILINVDPRQYRNLYEEIKNLSLLYNIDKISYHEEGISIFAEKSEELLDRILHILKERNVKINKLSLTKPSIKEIFEIIASKNESL